MFASRTSRRFRAVMIAVAITMATNYAISYAAKNSKEAAPLDGTIYRAEPRSGVIQPPVGPKPSATRSGVIQPAVGPKP